MLEFGEREITVFEGIGKLISSGANIYQMKVSDIAKAAGMGKGTVYDYFSSKEEMIAKAVVFNIEKNIRSIRQAVDGTAGFRAKFFVLLDEIYKAVYSGLPVLRVLVAGSNADAMREYVCGAYPLEICVQLAHGLVDGLLAAGEAEGQIARAGDCGYARMAVYSAVAGYCVSLKEGEWETKDKIRQDAYKILHSALNA